MLKAENNNKIPTFYRPAYDNLLESQDEVTETLSNWKGTKEEWEKLKKLINRAITQKSELLKKTMYLIDKFQLWRFPAPNRYITDLLAYLQFSDDFDRSKMHLLGISLERGVEEEPEEEILTTMKQPVPLKSLIKRSGEN